MKLLGTKVTDHGGLWKGAGALLVTALLVATSATAASASEEFDPLQVVEAQGLLQAPTDASIGNASRSAGTDKPSANSYVPVELQPVSEVSAELVEHLGAKVINEENFGFVTGTGQGGTNASFVVLKDETAPDSYQFRIGDASTSLSLTESGAVLVYDGEGTQVNYLQAPWARDSEGSELSTHYSIDGNVVTQHVETSDAVFPVTADPTTGCGIGWCSIYFNRTETNVIQAGGPAAVGAITAGCGLMGGVVAGGACAVGSGAIIAFASGAYVAGNCVGIVGYGVYPIGTWNPFVEPRGTSHCP